MRLERTREDMVTLTAKGEDLLTLVAGARIGKDALRADPSLAEALDGLDLTEALDELERLLAEFDRARARLEGEQPPAG
jgi:hypothetical protein